MNPIFAAVPDVVLLLEQIGTFLGTWHAASLNASVECFYIIPVNKNHENQFGSSNASLLSYLRDISTL